MKLNAKILILGLLAATGQLAQAKNLSWYVGLPGASALSEAQTLEMRAVLEAGDYGINEIVEYLLHEADPATYSREVLVGTSSDIKVAKLKEMFGGGGSEDTGAGAAASTSHLVDHSAAASGAGFDLAETAAGVRPIVDALRAADQGDAQIITIVSALPSVVSLSSAHRDAVLAELGLIAGGAGGVAPAVGEVVTSQQVKDLVAGLLGKIPDDADAVNAAIDGFDEIQLRRLNVDINKKREGVLGKWVLGAKMLPEQALLGQMALAGVDSVLELISNVAGAEVVTSQQVKELVAGLLGKIPDDADAVNAAIDGFDEIQLRRLNVDINKKREGVLGKWVLGAKMLPEQALLGQMALAGADSILELVSNVAGGQGGATNIMAGGIGGLNVAAPVAGESAADKFKARIVEAVAKKESSPGDIQELIGNLEAVSAGIPDDASEKDIDWLNKYYVDQILDDSWAMKVFPKVKQVDKKIGNTTLPGMAWRDVKTGDDGSVVEAGLIVDFEELFEKKVKNYEEYDLNLYSRPMPLWMSGPVVGNSENPFVAEASAPTGAAAAAGSGGDGSGSGIGQMLDPSALHGFASHHEPDVSRGIGTLQGYIEKALSNKQALKRPKFAKIVKQLKALLQAAKTKDAADVSWLNEAYASKAAGATTFVTLSRPGYYSLDLVASRKLRPEDISEFTDSDNCDEDEWGCVAVEDWVVAAIKKGAQDYRDSAAVQVPVLPPPPVSLATDVSDVSEEEVGGSVSGPSTTDLSSDEDSVTSEEDAASIGDSSGLSAAEKAELDMQAEKEISTVKGWLAEDPGNDEQTTKNLRYLIYHDKLTDFDYKVGKVRTNKERWEQYFAADLGSAAADGDYVLTESDISNLAHANIFTVRKLKLATATPKEKAEAEWLWHNKSNLKSGLEAAGWSF